MGRRGLFHWNTGPLTGLELASHLLDWKAGDHLGERSCSHGYDFPLHKMMNYFQCGKQTVNKCYLPISANIWFAGIKSFYRTRLVELSSRLNAVDIGCWVPAVTDDPWVNIPQIFRGHKLSITTYNSFFFFNFSFLSSGFCEYIYS